MKQDIEKKPYKSFIVFTIFDIDPIGAYGLLLKN